MSTANPPTAAATLDVSGPIATLTLRRPEARNSLSVELLAGLHARVDELRGRDDVRVCVVTGEGKAFCAGMDIRAILGDREAPGKLLTSFAELTWKVRNLPQVTIAKVNGPAVGGGCGLMVVCDLAVSFADNKLGFPEVDLGVSPAVVAPWLMRKIGGGRARAVLVKGGLVSGAEALAMGMLDHCAAGAGELESAAGELAGRIAQGGTLALRATKELLNQLDGSTDLETLRKAAKLSAEVFNSAEAQERMRAKLAK